MRQQAAAIKRDALNRLPELLKQAEETMQANGITVLWAVDAAEANRLVLDIAKRHNVRSAVKSKSMVTEEIGLNQSLESASIDVLETDLGEFIVQLGEETPSHIVVPVVHKTKESIRQLLIEEANMSPTDDTEEMANFARDYLRQPFLTADMGISGGNFIVAETGTICFVSNEGNIRLVTSLPRIHVALVGIEKVIATGEDYATLTQLLPRSATGQTMTVYTHMVNGPRRDNETDGPEHVYVIFVDNGRSQIYSSDYGEALACIRCGACLNVCPVYGKIGVMQQTLINDACRGIAENQWQMAVVTGGTYVRSVAGDMDLDAIYTFRLLTWLGPYIRMGLNTNLFPGQRRFDKMLCFWTGNQHIRHHKKVMLVKSTSAG